MKQFLNNHKAVLLSLKGSMFEWRLVFLFVAINLLTSLIMFLAYGDALLAEFHLVLEELPAATVAEYQALPIHVVDWIIPLALGIGMLFEFLWMAIVAYVTRQLLRYRKTPLSFKYLTNVFLLNRLYESVLVLAVLLGHVFVVKYVGDGVFTLPAEGSSIDFGMLAVSLFFWWWYFSNVRIAIQHRIR